jgi:Fe-S-cluster-containing hydrogenase component 2
MMDKKILTVDPEKCTGCRNCELVCSVRHNGVSNPSLARIQIVKWEDIGVYIPMSCQQCEDAPCMAVCPKDAIYRDEDLERIRINHELCIGCKMCVAACPVCSNVICAMGIRNACASATPRQSITWIQRS